MGIKYFFSWMKKTFNRDIHSIKMNQNMKEIANIDHFLVDMNGIFHYCCQKIYQYGSFKPRDVKEKYKTNSRQKQLQTFEMIGNYVDKLIRFVQPNKRVVLAIDGPAPLSKQIQQRSRRYRSAKDREDGVFDSNCITPGTTFLDFLSKYMDWFIRKKLQEGVWGDIEVVFSSEKVPGEGEHKLVQYVRNNGDINDHYMIQGMDADLVMLSLATHYPYFHILRENPYKYEHEYYYINMINIRQNLVNVLLCEQSLLDDHIYINDFIVMIFLTGNDFLPHLPTIEILEGGVENLFETYRTVVKNYGPITNQVGRLCYESFRVFLGTLGSQQIPFLQENRKKTIAFPDRLLEKHTKLGSDGEFKLDWESYRREYYVKMGISSDKEIEDACIKYIEGVEWVLTYYTKGVSNWKWSYPYYYAPFLSDIVNCFEKLEEKEEKERKERKGKKEKKSYAYPPFMQLLCVLPKESKDLLPQPLYELMTSPSLSVYYPDEIHVDMDGKHNDWEGVVILPPINFTLLEQEYEKAISKVDEKDKRRNMIGKSFVYSNGHKYTIDYRSFYGDIKGCSVHSNVFEL
jgi:5'-3' exonuclease